MNFELILYWPHPSRLKLYSCNWSIDHEVAALLIEVYMQSCMTLCKNAERVYRVIRLPRVQVREVCS